MVVNVEFMLKLYINHCFPGVIGIEKKLKDQFQNDQNRSSGEKAHHIYETYKNTVMPHGRHIYAKASEMANETMCAYPHSDNALPHWKCVLR